MIILSGQEAFAAMAAGQQIECRHTGSDLDFDSIRNFSATVFIEPDYEFRIAVVYMTIGTMQVPEAISEAPAKGTQCFAPSLLTSELSKSFKWKNSGSDLELLTRGLVHLYEDNAVVHAQALITVSRGSLNKEEPASDTSLPWGDENSQNPTSNDVEEKTSAEPAEDEIEVDPVKIVEEFTAKINACTTNDAVLSLRHVFLANGHLGREHHEQLCKQVENKLLELDPEQYTPKVETTESLSVNELKALQEEAEKLIQASKDDEYQTLLNDLLKRAAAASTPVEATALTKYTKAWTELQRKPLLDAIHKRLSELNPPEALNTEQPPSLMVQIQTAPDLTTLDGLEIDVATRHIDIQPKLMDYVKKRRFELENQGSEAAL